MNIWIKNMYSLAKETNYVCVFFYFFLASLPALEINLSGNSRDFLFDFSQKVSFGRLEVQGKSDSFQPFSVFAFVYQTNSVQLSLPVSACLSCRVDVVLTQWEFAKIKNSRFSGLGEGNFQEGVSIRTDAFDHLYVVDSRQDKIFRYTRNHQFLSSFGGFHVDTSASFSGDYSRIEESGLNRPLDLLSGLHLGYFVADSLNHRVVELDLEGRFVREIRISDGFDEPSRLAFNSRKDLFILDSQKERIVVLNSFLQKRAVLGGFGRGVYRFERPCDLFADSLDRLWVLDCKRQSISVFQPDFSHLKTFKAEEVHSFFPASRGIVALIGKKSVRFLTEEFTQGPKEISQKNIIAGTASQAEHLYLLKSGEIEEYAPRFTISTGVFNEISDQR